MTDFDKIYSLYFKDVYLYILRLSGNEHIAEEITSLTFYKALKSIDKFRGDCEIRVWLFQIAKNCYYTYLEKNKRIESLDPNGHIVDGEKNLVDTLEDKDTAKQIQKILHKMDNPYKEVFMWRVYAEMSFKDIGRIFSKNENWACVTYHRAKKFIIERLEKCGYEN